MGRFPSRLTIAHRHSLGSSARSFRRDRLYDRYRNERDDTAISAAARRGETLFFSQPLSCFRCHGGGGFSIAGAVDFEGGRGGDRREGDVEFHNTGLYNLAGALSYPPPNTGIFEFTRKVEDVGKFKAPTLRNIAVTAPFMHDWQHRHAGGRVLAHYRGGRPHDPMAPYRGIGHENPNKESHRSRVRAQPGAA